MADLKGRSVVVTGAGRGIGRAIALRLADDGADLVINDIESEPAEEVATAVREHGVRAIVDNADVTDAPFVLVVNETMAQGLFPDQNPVGRRVAVDFGRAEPVFAEVVGVVGDVRTYSLDSNPPRQMYFSFRQTPTLTMRFAIRTQGEAVAVTNSVRRVLQARGPAIPLAGVATMEDVITRSVGDARVIMLTLTLFSTVALFLAAIGLYSVLAYYVGQRSREIGIRLAMGASGGNILNLILRRGLSLVGVGLVIGVGAAFGATRLIQQQLFGVEPTDPVTFISVSGLFAGVAILACLIPAFRAVRVDPVKTLQAE